MEIRLTCHAATNLVAVSVARSAGAMPDEVRLVDEWVADAIEELVEETGDALGAVDLDLLIETAAGRARV